MDGQKLADLFILMLSLMLSLTGCKIVEKPKALEQNYGHSYGTVNIGSGISQDFSAEDVVPKKTELIDNLEKTGFSIDEYDHAPGSTSISAERIYAYKKEEGQYIDICYGLTIKQAQEVFEQYEPLQPYYYLIAQNEAFFYAVSDAETFALAGFESLETNGILFIWK
jgi:hypothetical protein